VDLTKREIQGVLEILHYSVEARTVEDVYQVLQLIQRVVTCPRVIGGVVQLNSKGTFGEFNSVINVSYSNDWLYTYGRNGYAGVDPVLQSVLSTFKTQVWEQTYKNTSSPKQLEFVEEARSYGLTHGITTGMVERGRGFASFFSFAGGDSDDTNRYKELLEYLLPYLHRVLIANTSAPAPNRVMGLSPREMVVLDWMKQGKTNWEISRIIGVSERTVRFHAESIFMKLDVGSRTQAVAFAIEHGLLSGA
jgi:DNA-binding CsgD family transcriptional regulator